MREIQNKVKQDIVDLYELENKFKGLTKKYENKKAKLVTQINNFFFVTKGEKRLKFDSEGLYGDKEIECKKITRKTINFDVDKVEDRIDKEITEQFVDKRIEIVDWDGVVELLKSHGVSPSEFKKLIVVSKSVNRNKLEQLYKLGVIDLNELKGCYTMQESEGYYKVTVMDKERGDTD